MWWSRMPSSRLKMPKPIRWCLRAACPTIGCAVCARTPKDGKARCHEQICAGVEDAVPDDVEFEVVQSVGGVTGTGQHMMPLQDLMQHDPVEEAAQPQAEKDSCQNGKIALADVSIHARTLRMRINVGTATKRR